MNLVDYLAQVVNELEQCPVSEFFLKPQLGVLVTGGF